MADTLPNLPRWLAHADGRLLAFDPDLIQRGLFAATASLGQPDPFLARELTDSVLHFLAAEGDDPVGVNQVNELVVKVVRELGQPALAQAFTPLGQPEAAAAHLDQIETHADPLQLARELAAPALRQFSLQSVYGPELAAAHQDGLLMLSGLEHPCEMSAAVLGSTSDWGDSLFEVRQRVGQLVVLDGPEYALADEADASRLVRDLRLGLRGTGLAAVANLNLSNPPPWAAPAGGPLFAGQARTSESISQDRLGHHLLDALPAIASLRLDWHLGERDFRADQGTRLLNLARRAAAGQPIALVFDRPRCQPALAEGIDRRRPYVLLSVGLNLPALAARCQPDHFLRKLGSLARLAVSAGVQKRDFLRRSRPGLAGGFVLERARLVLVPVGLDAVARLYHGQGMAQDAAALDFGRQAVQELVNVLKQECASRQLDGCIDSPAPGSQPLSAAGLTSWCAAAPPRSQLHAAGVLQHIAGAGTACLCLPDDRRLSAEELADLLRFAWQHTAIVRLRLSRQAEAQGTVELLPT